MQNSNSQPPSVREIGEESRDQLIVLQLGHFYASMVSHLEQKQGRYCRNGEKSFAIPGIVFDAIGSGVSWQALT